MHNFRLIAVGYFLLLFFVFLFVFARTDQSAMRDSAVVATAIPTVTSTPEPTATPTPFPVPNPTRLVIPRLDIDVAIESKGNDAEGRMEVPAWESVAWFNQGPKPGEEGSSVIAGHYDTNTGAPATFYALSSLQPGDLMYVTDETNAVRAFKVIDIRNYAYDLFPVTEVFDDPSGHKMNLITCSGTWDSAIGNYSDRLVVYTELQ